MRTTLILALAPAFWVAGITVAPAQWRSSTDHIDFSSCSTARDSCRIGTTRRGDSTAPCERAYKACMQTGVWDTYGTRHGRRVTDLPRR